MSKHRHCDEYEYCYQTAVNPYMGAGVAPQGGGCGFGGNNIWSLIVLLIILCKPEVLCNDRAFILILLFWLCGGSGVGAGAGAPGFGF
ncbi:hypothetical protein D3C76_721900 [compost metagenome]